VECDLCIIIVLPYYLLCGKLFDNFWNLEHTELSKVSTCGKCRFFTFLLLLGNI